MVSYGGLPLIIFVAANQILVKIRHAVQQHATLLVVTFITMFAWPLGALYVTCATGLDYL